MDTKISYHGGVKITLTSMSYDGTYWVTLACGDSAAAEVELVFFCTGQDEQRAVLEQFAQAARQGVPS